MTEKVIIREVGVYHPKAIMSNDFYKEHFTKQGKDITNLLKSLGRENRFIGDQNETSLTMATKATQLVLDKANLKGEDVDMIVFVSTSPEYLSPPNAVSIHHAIHGKLDTISFDMNAGCVGMILAVEQVSRTMMMNPHIKKALVVGSEQLRKFSREEDPQTYASFGDASCAVILEKQESEISGFVDSHHYTDSESYQTIVFPACGLTKTINQDLPKHDRQLKWDKVKEGSGVILSSGSINKVLERNHLTADDVNVYCLSQLSKNNVNKVREMLNQPEEKFVSIGEKYGYTGTSSPFITFAEAIADGKVQRGDCVLFWSVGAGVTGCSMLFRY